MQWTLGLALTWLPTYLEEQAGYAPSTVSLLVGLPSIFSIVSILVAGMAAGWPLLAAMTVAFSIGPALTPLANAAIADVCPPAQRSGVLATAHAFATTGSVAAPFASGLVVDLAPTESTGFAAALDLAGLLLLAGAAAAATAIRPDRHTTRSAA